VNVENDSIGVLPLGDSWPIGLWSAFRLALHDSGAVYKHLAEAVLCESGGHERTRLRSLPH